MGRRIVGLVAVIALLGAACNGDEAKKAAPTTRPTPTSTTLLVQGPLAPAVLTATQIRQVPGLSTSEVVAVESLAVFDDPDPRGPCGAKIPKIPLGDETLGVAFTAELIRGGFHLVTRFGPGEAQKYLDARMADSSVGCAEYAEQTGQDSIQRVRLLRIVRLFAEPGQQAVAVVLAVTVGGVTRATTEIEVRRGDVLSRVTVFTNRPIGNSSVRGIASVMAQNLLLLPE